MEATRVLLRRARGIPHIRQVYSVHTHNMSMERYIAGLFVGGGGGMWLVGK